MIKKTGNRHVSWFVKLSQTGSRAIAARDKRQHSIYSSRNSSPKRTELWVGTIC